MRTYLSVSLLLAAALSRGQLYHVTDLGLFPMCTYGFATGINSSGQVTGYDWLESAGGRVDHAFLWSNGTLMDIGAPGGIGAAAYGINDSGQIVGMGGTSTGTSTGFIYTSGTFQDIGGLFFGGGGFQYNAINSRGQVVGDSEVYPTGDHAFLYTSGVMQDLGALTGNSGALALSDLGVCVGWADTPSGYHAAIFTNGTIQDIGTLPGFANSGATGINASGQIIGDCTNQTFDYAFTYLNGVMQPLGTLGGSASEARGINAEGAIVGDSFLLGDYANHGFLYSNGVMQDLNSMLDASSQNFEILECDSINDSGLIVGYCAPGGFEPFHAFLLTPVDVSVALPDSLFVLVGTQTGGSLYSIQFSDSWYLTVQPGVTTLLSQSPVQAQLSGTSPTMSPSSFQFTFSAHVNSINLSESILLYNFNSGAYETLNTTAAHLGSDSTVTVTPSGDLTRFVNQSTGEVRARVNFSRAGATSVLRWTASLGVANWIIQ